MLAQKCNSRRKQGSNQRQCLRRNGIRAGVCNASFGIGIQDFFDCSAYDTGNQKDNTFRNDRIVQRPCQKGFDDEFGTRGNKLSAKRRDKSSAGSVLKKIKNQKLKIKNVGSAYGGDYFTLDSRFRRNDTKRCGLRAHPTK